MSTICAEECFALDMEWYGVDRQGHIAVFCSAGEGNLPKFVCEDRERADQLIEYFGGLKKSTGSVLLFPKTKRAEQVAREFSDRRHKAQNLYAPQALYPALPPADTAALCRAAGVGQGAAAASGYGDRRFLIGKHRTCKTRL